MEIIDQIKQAATIIDIAAQYTSLRKRGNKHVGLCPFHSEKTPSFTLDEEKQLFHCFGCGAGGDIFTLVMEKESLSFPEALRFLAQKYNIPLPERKKLSPQYKKLEEQLYKISDMALAFFKKNLFNTKEGKKALEYLKKRNVSEEIIQKLKIGYAENSWDSLLTFFQRKDISPGLLEKAGLILRRQKKEGFYDRFRGRIIFPIFTLSGKVVAFGGRSLFDEEPKYLNSPDTPIYTKGHLLYGLNLCKEAIQKKQECILVEGYTDFLSLYQAGIFNISASLGTSITPSQVSLSQRFAPKMILSYDGDSAGRKAALRAISLCFEKGVQIKVLVLPKGYDPDNFIRKNGVDRFKNLIEKSISGLKYLIDTHTEGAQMNIPEEKAKIAKNVFSEIEKIPDLVVRSEYLKQASELLSIDEVVLRSAIKKKAVPYKDKEKTVFLLAEKMLLQFFWENQHTNTKILSDLNDNVFTGLAGEPIFTALSSSLKKGKKLSLHELKQSITPDLFSALSEVLQEKEHPPSPEEAKECLNSLKQVALQKRCKEIQKHIQQLAKKKENDKIGLYLKEIQEITEQLSILSQQNS